MANKINFITGATYTLSEIFSGERRIIIPDLQRDYCWGDHVHTDERKELVSDFIISLMSQYAEHKHGKKMNLGLIYGYESPVNHIQLCDGQQRLTTLFLLIGMLNKMKSTDNGLRSLLISDYEYFYDDNEPYLNYAIRESSLYFLSDLVCHFFIKDEGDRLYVENLSDIYDLESGSMCRWFFGDYISDPSIQSMLNALRAIETAINNSDIKDWDDFCEFLTDRLTFMYYDMGNRSNGEETFVIINTTGEPLSTNQNLKPLVLSAKINSSEPELAERWEKIETWFWQHRDITINETADAGFNEFLRWITLIHFFKTNFKNGDTEIIAGKDNLKFPVEKISMSDIEIYFNAVRFIFSSDIGQTYFNKTLLSPKNPLSSIDCFKLLPIIEYVKLNNINDINSRNLLRFCEFLENLTRKENITKSVNSLICEIVRIANLISDPAELIDMNVSTAILDEEEILKFKIFIADSRYRNDIENEVWNAQRQKIWGGEIMPLIEWSMDNGNFDIDKFIIYRDCFNSLFAAKDKSELDLLRRALLTRNLVDYPIGGTSFGWDDKEWKTIVSKNSTAFKTFIDQLIESTDANAEMNSMIEQAKGDDFRYKFAKHKFLLEYCNQKHICHYDNEGIMLCERKWSRPFSMMNAILLYSLGSTWQKSNYLNELPEWMVWTYISSPGCLVLENEESGLAIDIHFNRKDGYFYGEIFHRKGKPVSISALPNATGIVTDRGGRYFTFKDKDELINILRNIHYENDNIII